MKRYSENERNYIIKRLKTEAQDCLRLFGVKKTSVDELTSRVNISTGTFYLIYPSKEHLLYEVICDYKKDIIHNFHVKLEIAAPLSTDLFAQLLFNCIKEAMESFLLQIARNEEMEYIMRKLPEDLVEHNEAAIKTISRRLLDFLPTDDSIDFEELLTSFEVLFYSATRKTRIGEQLYYGSLWMLLGSLSEKLMRKDQSGVSLTLPQDRSLFI